MNRGLGVKGCSAGLAAVALVLALTAAVAVTPSQAALETFVPNRPTIPEPDPIDQLGRGIAIGDDFAVTSQMWFEGYGYSNLFTYETVVFYDVDRSGVLQDEGVTFTIRNITTPQEIIDDFGNPGLFSGFGFDVASNGRDWVAVGSPECEYSGSQRGSVFIYRRDNVTHDWSLDQRIDGDYSHTGYRVVAEEHGDVLVLGIPYFSANRGKVQVYRDVDGIFVLEATIDYLDGAPQSTNFGLDVAVHGDHLIVGAPGAGFGEGYAATYVYNATSGGWDFGQVFAGVDSAFGYSVAVSNEWMVVGGPTASPAGSDRGMISIFQRNHTTNSWELFQSYYHDESGADNDYYGYSAVFSSEGYFLVGVYGISNNLGRIDRWDFDTEAGNWARTALLEPNTDLTQPHFGARIAVSGDLVLGTSFENDLYINREGIGYKAWEFVIEESTSTPPPVAPIHFEAFQFCSVLPLGTCDGDDTDLCENGVYVCDHGTTAYTCNDDGTNILDLCDGLDNDCNEATVDGADEPVIACDGPEDVDLCTDAVEVCVNGSMVCNDLEDDPSAFLDTCDGSNNDCNGATGDGFHDQLWQMACDSDDADNCTLGIWECNGIDWTCENDVNVLDVCNGVDDDCNSTTPDGFADINVGGACDSNDTNSCLDDYFVCSGGSLKCVDNATVPDSAYVEVCNLVDEDCDGVTDEDAGFEYYLDSDGDNYGDDAIPAVLSCLPLAGYTTNSGDCDDSRADIRPGQPELCDGLDNDCDPATIDGSVEPGFGAVCDGSDDDLCEDGTMRCTSGSGGTFALACVETTANRVDICNGVDDDCDPSTADGSGLNGFNSTCFLDSDNCDSGHRLCPDDASLGNETLVCVDDDDVDMCFEPCSAEACGGFECDEFDDCLTECDGRYDCQGEYLCDYETSRCVGAALVGELCASHDDCGRNGTVELYCRGEAVCAAPESDNCPAIVKEESGLSDELVLLVAIGASVGGVALIVMASSFIADKACGRRASAESGQSTDHIVSFSLGVAALDLVTDIFFVRSIGGAWAYAGYAFIITPLVVNIFVALGFFFFEIRKSSASADMKAYAKSHLTPIAVIVVLSTLNLEILALLDSNIFGLALFAAPLSPGGDRLVRLGRLSNVILEDVPQLVLTLYVTQTCAGFTPLAWLTVGFSTFSMLVLIVSKLFYAFVNVGGSGSGAAAGNAEKPLEDGTAAAAAAKEEEDGKTGSTKKKVVVQQKKRVRRGASSTTTSSSSSSAAADTSTSSSGSSS